MLPSAASGYRWRISGCCEISAIMRHFVGNMEFFYEFFEKNGDDKYEHSVKLRAHTGKVGFVHDCLLSLMPPVSQSVSQSRICWRSRLREPTNQANHFVYCFEQ